MNTIKCFGRATKAGALAGSNPRGNVTREQLAAVLYYKISDLLGNYFEAVTA